MTLPRCVAEVLSEHVRFEVECIDRMYLKRLRARTAVPGRAGGLRAPATGPVASTAPLAKITDAFSGAVHRFAVDRQVPWVDFTRGPRKDDVMHEHLAAFEAAGRYEGVVFIGRTQEKTPPFRTEKRHTDDRRAYPWIVKSNGMVNHFYF